MNERLRVNERHVRTALLINTAYLGDVVFTLPVISNLARAGYVVDLLARPRLGEIARGVTGLRDVLAYDKRGAERGPLALARLGRRLRAARYDLVVGAHPSVRSGLLAAATGAPVRVGWGPIGYTHRVPRGPRFVEDALALLEAAGFPTPERRPRLAAPTPAGHPAEQAAGGVALAPGSNWATKRWSPAQWSTLATALRADGLLPVWIGVDGERPLTDIRAGDLDAMGLGLGETAALLAGCAAMVGGDSGLTHLASAAGVPVVALFGPTPHDRHPPAPDRIDLFVADLACRPCSPHGPAVCPEGHHRCMSELDAERVRRAVRDAVSRCGDRDR